MLLLLHLPAARFTPSVCAQVDPRVGGRRGARSLPPPAAAAPPPSKRRARSLPAHLAALRGDAPPSAQVPMSDDHKPNNEEERDRIVAVRAQPRPAHPRHPRGPTAPPSLPPPPHAPQAPPSPPGRRPRVDGARGRRPGCLARPRRLPVQGRQHAPREVQGDIAMPMLCYAVLCYVVLCYAMPCCYAVLCCAMLWHAMPCHDMLCYAMQGDGTPGRACAPAQRGAGRDPGPRVRRHLGRDEARRRHPPPRPAHPSAPHPSSPRLAPPTPPTPAARASKRPHDCTPAARTAQPPPSGSQQRRRRALPPLALPRSRRVADRALPY